MKKPKVSLNGAAIKNFFINNGEKLVLGVVVLLLINFAYGAITVQPIDPNKANQIKEDSARAQAEINKTQWDPDIKNKPEYFAPNYDEEAQRNNQPLTQVAKLTTDRPFNPDIFKDLIKRADPKILPAMEVTGSGQIVLVPYLRELEAVNNLANPNVQQPRIARKEEEKAKKAAKGGKTVPGGEVGGEYPAGRPPVPGARHRVEEDMPATAPTTDRSVSGAPLAGTRATNAELKPKAMAIVTALVPYEEQYKEYKKRFEDALGKGSMPASQGGDEFTPVYYFFFIERAEVKDHRDENLVWTKVDVGAARREINLMVPTNQQIEPPIDPQYSFLQSSAASNPDSWIGFFEWQLPPVILRNWGFEVTHPKVPFQTPQLLEEMQGDDFFVPGQDPNRQDPNRQGPNVTRPQPGGGQRFQGGPRPFGGHRGGMGDEFGGRGMRQMPGAGRFGGGGESMAGMTAEPQVPYKLFRYVDLTCAPGKRYRYRVRFMLDNPNFNLMAAFLENPDSAKQQWVYSDWSAPSSVIEIPMNGQALAVAAAGTPANEPEAQISIQQIVKWETKEDKKKKAATGPGGDPLAGGAGFQNLEPTSGWVEVLQEKLKVSLGGLVYFPNQAVEKVLDMAVEIEKKKVEGLMLSCQPGKEVMLLDVRSDDPLGLGKPKGGGVTEMLYFAPDGRLFSTHSGVDRLKSEDYKDRTYVPANITGGIGPGGLGDEFGPPRGRFRGD